MTEAEDAPGVSLSQVRGIVTRGRWWVLLAACASAVAAIAIAYLLPSRFTSEATLVVVEQQVSQKYVTSASTLGIADELQAITQEVLSRKRLLALIEQFGLFPKERQRLAPEEVIALMQKYIHIEPIEPATGSRRTDADFNAFKISFTADSAILARDVTSRLTSLFIEENLKAREERATTTTNFLSEHLGAVKNRLAAQEERLRDFKMRYLGELPEQQQGNLAILTSAQAQLQNTTASLDRAQQQRVYLESLLSGYQRMASRAASLTGPSGPGDTPRATDPVQVLQSDLNLLQTSRAQLLSRYSDRHPDVMAVDREISAKQALLQSYRSARAAAPPAPGSQNDSAAIPNGASPRETEDAASTAQLKSQLEANRLEIENLTKDEKQQKASIAQYQSRLNLTPVREQQLAGILRDYELSKSEYLDLLGKEQQSQLAMSLEKRQGGQQFRLINSPSLPTLRSSPKRLKIALGGVLGGILLGLALAVLAEIATPRLYDEEAVRVRFATPLVVGLPLLPTPGEERLRTWRMVFEWSAGSVVTVAVLAAEYYVYRHP
jgi:polysaccharide chain length determinant protein (PEP-CTERM system associated)